MESANFFKLLWRYKITLILFPLAAAILTFFLLRNTANTYRSTARIATGLVERSDEFINKTNQGEGKISQEFSNIIQMMLLKKIVERVSFQLMIHDLTMPGEVYRKESTVVQTLTSQQKLQAIAILNDKYLRRDELSLWDKQQNMINKMLISQKYDYESLIKKLNVYRLQTSDYIYLDFESENPLLSAYVLNTLCSEFINYYTLAMSQRSNKSVAYFDSLLRAKQHAVTEKVNDLKNFKIQNGILDVNNQATVLMGQIADYQEKKQENEKNILTYQRLLQDISTNLARKETTNGTGDIAEVNQTIIDTRHWLDVVNEQYVKSNYDPKFKVSIDSLQTILFTNISIATGAGNKSNTTERQERREMIKDKMTAEASLDMARKNVVSLDSMVRYLSTKLDLLTPSQANIQVYEKDIETQGKEYEELTNKLNQTRLESSFATTLRQVEMAMPEPSRPSKKILLIALSGVASFLLVAAVLFVIFFFDHSISDTQQLAVSTNQPVIGSLGVIAARKSNTLKVWSRKIDNNTLKSFKSQLRSIRFEVDSLLGESKIIAITSLHPHEGKTFLSYNLAKSYKTINKKVLLVDGNFDNPAISIDSKPEMFLENFLSAKEISNEVRETENYDLVIMGNNGQDISLLETTSTKVIESRFNQLRESFDIILVEIPPLDTFNKAREWISFSDKVICVFSSGNSLTKDSDRDVQYLESLNGKLMGWVINKVAGSKGKKRPSKI